MNRLPNVAIIIHWGDLRPTIEVASQYDREAIFSVVVVVANDLQPCPTDLLDSKVSWIVPPRNLGFGGACNYGAHLYPGTKYAFLNADVKFSSGAVARCLEALDLAGIGISAPTLYFPDGNLQSGCGTVSRYMKIPHVKMAPIEQYQECEWVTGAALFCRGEVLEALKFDGSYFLGFEDVDFGYRAKREGWKIVVLSKAMGIHPARTTLKRGRPVYYGARNQIWFSRRHGSALGSVAATLYMLSAMPRVMLADVVKRRAAHSRLLYHGLVAGWRTLPVGAEPLDDEPIPARWMDWRATE